MRIPSACSLRSLSEGSVIEHQEGDQALNLSVTSELLTRNSSPLRAKAVLSRRSGQKCR